MSYVEVVDDGVVRTIRLNRPDRLNALGSEVRDAIARAVAETEDAPVRIVVFEGAGRAFSAGADLKDKATRTNHDETWQRRRRTAGAWGRLLDRIEQLPQVTVASLHGYVIGGAFLLAAACDLRVGAEDTLLSIPEVAIGIPLTWAGIPRLAREVGISRTREIILTGRRITGSEALAWGFLHRLGDRATETARLVGELIAMPEAPLAMSKDALLAHGRTIVSLEASWSDPDLIMWSGREQESVEAALSYLKGTVDRTKKEQP
jgi:enoyl-CoA hydratase/carnithine racemase